MKGPIYLLCVSPASCTQYLHLSLIKNWN